MILASNCLQYFLHCIFILIRKLTSNASQIAFGSREAVGLQRPEVNFLSQPSLLQVLMSVVDQTNQNLTKSQKELLLLHHKFGHIDMTWIQRLAAKPKDSIKQPILRTKNTNVSSCELPLCAACQLAKQTIRTPNSKTSSHPLTMILKRNDLTPGQTVSMD